MSALLGSQRTTLGTSEHSRAPDRTGALHPYAASVLAELQGRLPWEREYLQAVEEVFRSISPMLERDPRYRSQGVLERMIEPERVISFRVVWTDDSNQVHVNRGWRVQFNSLLGPYKGGTRFHASVSLSSLKFLGFEQIFKNALTGLALGGGKGGADFSTRGRSDGEIMRFCQAYMTELARHIGASVDVPAGDIGVGGREIGWLFGQYRRLTGRFDGTLTGKGRAWGGTLLRPEATGFGLGYFVQEMLRTAGEPKGLAGKRVAISGFGNVAWGAAKKVTELGGQVITLSGPDGYVIDPDGVKGERHDYMLEMRAGGRDQVRAYAERFGVRFVPGRRPWEVPCDVALPCAIQNELDVEDARSLVANGCRCVAEGANMPTSPEAMRVFSDAGVLFAPGKASNAGGVAVSGLEMAQNGSGVSWPSEQVDSALRGIMHHIHSTCLAASERFGQPGDYVAGANLAGFAKVADAMLDQGVM